MAEDKTPDNGAGKGSPPWRNEAWLTALAAVLVALGACLIPALDKLVELVRTLHP